MNKSNYYGSVQHIADLHIADIQRQEHFCLSLYLSQDEYDNPCNPLTIKALNTELTRLAKNN